MRFKTDGPSPSPSETDGPSPSPSETDEPSPSPSETPSASPTADVTGVPAGMSRLPETGAGTLLGVMAGFSVLLIALGSVLLVSRRSRSGSAN
ncbi:LPXTG cell wall anchor domain-containing protein [Arthrobacter halodurans]|uniref:LPXTG cell wall anchor domain-containing protein n=1 Tax=Arthrobacter halodurans TaxID=516699 RepID=A0ABV4UNK2_9MICC